MVPASTFMYGSILMAVTFSPVIFNRRPVDEAICGGFKLRVVRIGLWAQTNDPLSDTTDDTTRNNNVLCHDDKNGWSGYRVVGGRRVAI
jgi:hypothetical protein